MPSSPRFYAEQSTLSRRGLLRAGLAAGGTLAVQGVAGEVLMPRRGGLLRAALAHGSSSDTLDPAGTDNDFTIALAHASNGYLTEMGADGVLAGELAERWESSADSRVWHFDLLRGVSFHDGRPLLADDVVASFEHHRSRPSAVAPMLAELSAVRAAGPHRVRFELVTGNVDFAFLCADYHLPIKPANADGTLDWRSGTGLGGYRIEHFEPGVRAMLRRFADYWKPDRAHFDAVELLSVLDKAARMNALRSGEVDLISRPDLHAVARLRDMPGIEVDETAGNGHLSFAMLTDTAPFDDNEVRLALKHGIDREALLDTVLAGHGSPGNDHPIGPANRFRASPDELPQRTYDPERARHHLGRAGLSRLAVRLSAADAAFAGAVEAGVLYREHAAAAGMDIEVVREPDDGYWSTVWRRRPFCAVYWSGRPTEDWMFQTAYARGARWNDTRFHQPRFEKLLREARAERDDARRRALYVEMQRIVRDLGGTVVPVFNSYVWARASRLRHGPQLAADFDLDGQRFAERWWFA